MLSRIRATEALALSIVTLLISGCTGTNPDAGPKGDSPEWQRTYSSFLNARTSVDTPPDSIIETISQAVTHPPPEGSWRWLQSTGSVQVYGAASETELCVGVFDSNSGSTAASCMDPSLEKNPSVRFQQPDTDLTIVIVTDEIASGALEDASCRARGNIILFRGNPSDESAIELTNSVGEKTSIHVPESGMDPATESLIVQCG